MAEPGDLTKNIPPAAPKWSVGIVTIIAALVGGFMLLWGYVQPLVQKNLDSSIEYRGKQQEGESKVIQSLLGLITSNQAQIGALTEAMNEAQRRSSQNSERISVLEKELMGSKQGLTDCEEKLKHCKK